MNPDDVWQEVNCPQHDYDIFGDDMVYEGQTFDCLACGSTHIAKSGLVETFRMEGGEMAFPDLPKTPEELRALKAGCAY